MNKVKDRNVKIFAGNSVIYFSGGEDGKDYEIGEYCFWVAEGEDEYGPWSVIARALIDLPATDRFQRMDQERLMSKDGEDRIIYQMIWDRFDTIDSIRPACMREILRWIDTHKEESKYAGAFATINDELQLIPRKMI